MKHNRIFALFAALLVLLCLAACGKTQAPDAAAAQTQPREQPTAETEEPSMQPTLSLTINDTPVAVAWETNEAVRALQDLTAKRPLRVELSMYGGFEQVGSLGTALAHNDRRMTTSPGDIVLYAGNQIVLLYGENSWSYTPLGTMTGLTQAELTALLGNGNVTVTIANGK